MTQTLTGFDARTKTAGEWKRYISELRAARQVVIIKFKTIANPTVKQRIAAISRYDLLSEHISRAEAEMKSLPE